ncbi:MAG: 23S rRNA (pseudouridine(1915)-N(3))-methyltransferase RlmH [Pseudomonadota bacterium]
MRVTVHSVCGKMPGWVEQAVDDYQRRLPRELRLSWRNVPLSRRGRDRNSESLRERDGAALLKGLSPDDHCVALDSSGQAWSTERLAVQLEDWQSRRQDLSFLIGGPDGLSSRCLKMAGQRWSLGSMTLPHPLVRVVLVEQIYRAWTINVGHPYHRGASIRTAARDQ